MVSRAQIVQVHKQFYTIERPYSLLVSQRVNNDVMQNKFCLRTGIASVLTFFPHILCNGITTLHFAFYRRVICHYGTLITRHITSSVALKERIRRGTPPLGVIDLWKAIPKLKMRPTLNIVLEFQQRVRKSQILLEKNLCIMSDSRSRQQWTGLYPRQPHNKKHVSRFFLSPLWLRDNSVIHLPPLWMRIARKRYSCVDSSFYRPGLFIQV